MKTKQINLKLPENLVKLAEDYAKKHGFRNIQELAASSIREKIIDKNGFDENFSEKEINLIDSLIQNTIKNKDLHSEKELKEILSE